MGLTYSVFCIKQLINKGLLYNTGSYTQYFVVTYKGKDSEKTILTQRYKTANTFGGRLELVNVNEKIKKVFEMSGLLKIIPVIDNYKQEIAN